MSNKDSSLGFKLSCMEMQPSGAQNLSVLNAKGEGGDGLFICFK